MHIAWHARHCYMYFVVPKIVCVTAYHYYIIASLKTRFVNRYRNPTSGFITKCQKKNCSFPSRLLLSPDLSISNIKRLFGYHTSVVRFTDVDNGKSQRLFTSHFQIIKCIFTRLLRSFFNSLDFYVTCFWLLRHASVIFSK